MTPRPNRQTLVRLVAIALVLLLVVAGAGLGTNSSVTEFVRESSERISAIINGGPQPSPGAGTPLPPGAERTPPVETPTRTPAAEPTPDTATPSGEGSTTGDTATATESATTATSRSAESRNTRAAAPTLNLELGGTGQTNIFDTGADGAVAPGAAGVNRVTLTNSGEHDGVLELTAVEYTSDENGLTGAESAVDATGGDPGVGAGELHEVVEIRVTVASADGSSRYVIGDDTSYRTISSLADATIGLGSLGAGESVDLVVEFRVPVTVGNEIQSDTIVVDFQFGLRD